MTRAGRKVGRHAREAGLHFTSAQSGGALASAGALHLLPPEVWGRLLGYDAAFASRGALSATCPAVRQVVAPLRWTGHELSRPSGLCPRFVDEAGRPVPFCRILQARTFRWAACEERCSWCALITLAGDPPPCRCRRCTEIDQRHAPRGRFVLCDGCRQGAADSGEDEEAEAVLGASAG